MQKYNINNPLKRLTIIGNGFDLAHNLRTGYHHFMSWYFNQHIDSYIKDSSFEDLLFKIIAEKDKVGRVIKEVEFQSVEHALDYLSHNKLKVEFKTTDKFFRSLVNMISKNNWVDIEAFYFRYLKSIFNHNILGTTKKRELVNSLNASFDFLLSKLREYLVKINNGIDRKRVMFNEFNINLQYVFELDIHSELLVLNFNYTDTLIRKHYVAEDYCLYIHGRVSDFDRNPLIFGYGDESDPDYQKIEDSGDNIYLQHIKSFGYFLTNNYKKLLSFIDSGNYDVFIIGHSCGLSDRILLNEIFEHHNFNKIHVFYHRQKNGNDNYKEITQEISRHFKPANKNMMRRKVQDKDEGNVIPQIIL